jgi:16S rRNA (guanine(966)-N(2))-methyltransferase RsmD
MVLRLVTGKYKGKVLSSSDTAKELRPTQAIVREAIINTFKSLFLTENIDPYYSFEEIEILDLYSGSGSMGYEFLSNGVKKVNFVDYDPKCLKLLKTNMLAMNLVEKVEIYRGELPSILKKIAARKKNQIDLVFFDPPFKITVENYLETLKAIFASGVLKTNALLLMEYKSKELETQLLEGFLEELTIVKTKNYGDCFNIIAQKTALKNNQ